MALVSVLVIASLLSFQHHYLIHSPWDYQKWWHAGYKEAITSILSESDKYEQVIISSADEPSLIFFLFFARYLPDQFRKDYSREEVELANFGPTKVIGKYHLPKIGASKGLYELGSVLPENTLYLATSKEINLDLIKEPNRLPDNLVLIKSVANPSGTGAFYIFKKKS